MSQADYSPLERLLHRLALGPRFIREATFDLETARLPKGFTVGPQPVFIAGLARSGSTILLNSLYQAGVFRSLTYRDMPFVLMPGRWRQMSGSSRRHMAASERAHGDRLLVDYDSPEAFEEVFWLTFCGDDYVQPQRLTPHQAGAATRDRFRRYVAAVLASAEHDGQVRYLSKNNNNLLRLPTIAAAFSDAHILIPFREPLQHALSLQQQHARFCQSHAQDRFAMRYMSWLGHFEFGLGHKHYEYQGRDNPFDPADANYWLQCWLDAYSLAQATAPAGSVFVGYEQLCEAGPGALDALFERVGAPRNSEVLYEQAADKPDPGVSGDLLARCREVYNALRVTHLQPVEARGG